MVAGDGTTVARDESERIRLGGLEAVFLLVVWVPDTPKTGTDSLLSLKGAL